MATGSYQGRRFSVEGKDRTILVGVILLFFLLVVRLFALQIIKNEYYTELSEENRIRIVPVEPPRGLIYDRHGTLLVENYPSYTVSVLPHEVAHIEETMERLQALIDADSLIFREQCQPRPFRFSPVKIQRDVPFDVVSSIEENRLDLPGVICQVEPKRRYVFGETVCHVIGYTGEISEKELQTFGDRGYLYGWSIGKDGIERAYEEDLKGHNGFKYLEVNAVGREIGLVQGKDPIPPVPGKNLHLTIDIRLQQFADDLFGPDMAGSIVALDPRTGEILAMVSKPSFDPNRFSSVLSPEDWMALTTDPGHPLLNRATKATYPPGSTLKIITAAAGLETGTINLHSRFQPCTGEMKFGNRVFHCWAEEGHGSLDLQGAIAQSCDVYFYQLGRKVGLNDWSKYARLFGFGRTVGIDLEGEEGGLVPSVEYYNKRYGKRRWSSNLIVNLSVGQGEILATPLQLAVFAGMIGMEGVWYRPHLVKAIELPSTGQIITSQAQAVSITGLSKAHYEVLKKAMVAVVNGPGGTARGAAVPGVTVAGKTGTAQNPHGADHAWFICFAPADDPALAVAVLVERGGKGSAAAAPLAKRLIQAYLFDDYDQERIDDGTPVVQY
jgi:penicillin-binding protein 2